MPQSYNISHLNRKFSKTKSGIIFMNIAKKRIQIALDLVQKHLNEVEYIVWIAPSNFLKTLIYTNAIKMNSQYFKNRIKYWSAETISTSGSRYLDLYNFAQNHKTFCIIDEALTFKNLETGRTQRLLFLSNLFTYKLLLCSAPATQGLIDFYTQLEFLDSKILRMNEKQFSNIFMPYRYQSYMVLKHWSRPKDEKKLLKAMKPYILGYDIKPKYIINHHNFFFDLTPKEQENYLYEKKLFIKNKKRIVFMDLVQHFQRIYTLAQSKLYKLQDLIRQIVKRKEKVLIYCKYVDEIDCIIESHVLDGLPYCILKGRSNKRLAIKEFEHKTDIMFCTYGVEKFGLDMQICNNIIYYSQTFDYRYKIQSLDSVVFEGFPTHINTYDFWVNTNLEHLMRDSLEHKKVLLSNIYGDITKTEALQL